MKKINFAALIFFGLSSTTYAQRTGLFPQAFYLELEQSANKEYDGAYESVPIDSMAARLFRDGTARIRLDSVARWQIMFEIKAGWSHTIGQPIHIKPFPSKPGQFAEPKKDNETKIKKAYNDSKTYTGNELLNGLGMDPKFFTAVEKADGFPLTIARDATWNRVFMPVTSNRYMALRFVWSYPDGNVSSSYSETIFYFRRVD